MVRYITPVCHDYRKHREKTELGNRTGSIGSRTGEGGQHPINRPPNHNQTLRPNTNRDNQNSEERLPVHRTLDQWRNYRHKGKRSVPIVRPSVNSRRGNVEDRRTHLDCMNQLVYVYGLLFVFIRSTSLFLIKYLFLPHKCRGKHMLSATKRSDKEQLILEH